MTIKKWVFYLSAAVILMPGAAFPETAGNTLEVSETAYGKGKRVSMDFENAALKDILKAFSKQAGINIVASEVIEDKPVTVYLNNVSIEEAMDSLLLANGLTYEKKEGNVYLIKTEGSDPIKTITRVYFLNYIQVYDMDMRPEGAGFAQTGDELSAVPSSGSSSSSGTTSSSTTASMPVSTGSSESTVMSGSSSSSDEPPRNIIAVLKSLISQHGKIVANRRNNSLVITDIPSSFEAIETTIKELDTEPVQIMIEAEIIETTTDAVKRIGIQYGTETQTAAVTWGTTTDGNDGTRFSAPIAFPLTNAFVKNTYSAALAASPLFQYGTLTAADTSIVLQLFVNNEDTKLLSRPRIMTINNEPAVFKVSANTAIGIDSVNSTQSDLVIEKAERVETGIILKVVPNVNKNGDIFMYVEPSIARAVGSTFFENEFMDPQTRSSSSTVMVKDGDTIIIAGLITTDNYKTVRKVPFLGDIPFLGEPFKSNYKKSEDTEVLIFITPHVVKKRDTTFIVPAQMSERERIIERALDKYSVKDAKKTAKRQASEKAKEEALNKAREKADKAAANRGKVRPKGRTGTAVLFGKPIF